jgi:predicted DsbA family dithiol-disulfide isomerase
LAKWAGSKGKGEEYHKSVFQAYFVEGRNIGKPEELVLLSKTLRLPEDEARKVLKQRTFKEAVDTDWARCRALGITAVPTFVIDHQRVVGFQPYGALEQLLKTKNIRKRT